MKTIVTAMWAGLLIAFFALSSMAHANERQTNSVSLLDINTATQGQLAEHLPGIGPAKAALIIEFREKNGAFTHIDQLQQVKGIGPKTVEKLRTLVRVGSAANARQSQLKHQQMENTSKVDFRRVISSANSSAQAISTNTRRERAWYRRSLLEIMRSH